MVRQQVRQPPTDSVPQRVPEGFLLSVEMSDRKKGIAMSIFGLVWLVFSSFMLALVIRDSDYVGILFLSLFVLIGLALTSMGLLSLWTSLKLHPAELILPRYPLRLGETCSVRYRRRLRNGTFNKPGKIEAQLICDEWIQYRQGTDTKTRTHSLYELELLERTVVTGEQQADYEDKIVIPAEAPPAFSADHNKVRWRLLFKLKVPGVPQICRSEFLLKVVPEVVARSVA